MSSMLALKKVDNTLIFDVDDATGMKVGASGSGITEVRKYTVTFDPASVAAATTAEQTVTVTGVATGDIVLSVTKPTLTAGVGIVNARVSAANTVAITFVNATAGAVDPASESYVFVVARFG